MKMEWYILFNWNYVEKSDVRRRDGKYESNEETLRAGLDFGNALLHERLLLLPAKRRNGRGYDGFF